VASSCSMLMGGGGGASGAGPRGPVGATPRWAPEPSDTSRSKSIIVHVRTICQRQLVPLEDEKMNDINNM
jgi:hypothetical protein